MTISGVPISLNGILKSSDFTINYEWDTVVSLNVHIFA